MKPEYTLDNWFVVGTSGDQCLIGVSNWYEADTFRNTVKLQQF